MRGLIDRAAYRLPNGEVVVAVETWGAHWLLYHVQQLELGGEAPYDVDERGIIRRRHAVSRRDLDTGWDVTQLEPVGRAGR